MTLNRLVSDTVTARFLVTASSEMQSVAVAWQVYGLTHRPVDLGLVGLAQFLPGVLLFLGAGQMADRVSRQRGKRDSRPALSTS